MRRSHPLSKPPRDPAAANSQEREMNQSTVQIVAGVLAVLLIVIVVMRRKGKKKTDDDF